MAKLYSNEEIIDNVNNDFKLHAFEQLSDELSVYSNNLDLAVESFTKTMVQYDTLSIIQENINKRKIASESYFVTISDYSDIVKSISNNLGVKAAIPSLETFKNKYSTARCHAIATEGVIDILRTIWKKIKEFFIDLFKKIRLFFRRLLKLDMDLDEYEKYVEKMISKINTNKKELVKGIIVQSKLVPMIADVDLNKYNTHILLTDGVARIKNFIDTYKLLIDNLKTYELEVNPVLSNATERLTESTKSLRDLVSELTNKSKELLKSETAITEGQITGFMTKAEEINKTVKLNETNINSYMTGILKATTTSFNLVEDDKAYLPEKVQEIVSDINNKVVVKKLNIREKQVSRFNIYFIYSYAADEDNTEISSKFNVVSNIEKNTRISTDIELLRNAQNIQEMYSLYKELSKIDIKKLNSSLEKLEDMLQRTIDSLSRSITMMQQQTADVKETIKQLHSSVKASLPSDSRDQAILDTLKERDSIANSEISDLEKQQNRSINKLTNILLGQLTMTKEVSHAMSGIYGELRVELIKYIYKSAEQYN